MANIINYETWYQYGLGNALPAWFGGPNGQANGIATGKIIDGVISLLKSGATARYPSQAPSDALSHIGSDRGLIQGANESETSFRTRLKTAWDQWSRAGTPRGVLEQLFYFGFGSTTTHWVQQNGLAVTFSADPTPGQDPTSLVVTSNCPTLSTVLTSTLTSFRSIPVGTPWFELDDGNTDFCNRFAIICESWPFAALGFATFSGTDTATVTWPFTFPDTAYNVIVGPPNDAVVLTAGGTTATTTQITIDSSAPWNGRVPVLAFESGVNPLNFFSAARLGQLQRLITSFKPCSVCTGVYAIATGGRTWDYFPAGTTWDGGTYPQWDTNTVSQILAEFR